MKYFIYLLLLFFSCTSSEKSSQKTENLDSLKLQENQTKEVVKERSIRPIIADSSIFFYEKTTNKDIFLEIKLGKYINDIELDSVYYVLDLKNVLPKDTLLVWLGYWRISSFDSAKFSYSTRHTTNTIHFESSLFTTGLLDHPRTTGGEMSDTLFISSEFVPLLLPNSSLRVFIALEKKYAQNLELHHKFMRVRIQQSLYSVCREITNIEKVRIDNKHKKEIFLEATNKTVEWGTYHSYQYAYIKKGIIKPQDEKQITIPLKDIYYDIFLYNSYAIFDIKPNDSL